MLRKFLKKAVPLLAATVLFSTFSASSFAAGAAQQPSICDRACWGSRSTSLSTNMATLNRAIIHHTAGSGDYNVNSLADGAAKVRATQNYHMDVNGWSDIGYHFLVDRLGNAFEGRRDSMNKSVQRRGAHDGTNTNSFGFTALGYYHPPYNQTFTVAQRNKMWDVIAWRMPNGWSAYGQGTYNGKTVGFVDGHRDVKATACPGDGIYNTYIGTNHFAGIARDEIQARIDGTIGGGTPITNLGGWYRFKAKHSNKYLDIAPDHVSNGANLQQSSWVGGANQIFQLEHQGDGYYRIWAKSAGETRVLDVASCGTANGSNVQQWDSLNNDCQRFRIEDVGGGYVRLVAKNSGRVLDVAGSSTSDGANVAIWDWHAGDNQKFQMEWVSMPATNLSGAYKVISAETGRVLDVAPDHVSNGANVQMYDYLGGNNQKFTFEHLGGGVYKIWAVSAGSNRVLDVQSCGTANGSNLQQWDWANNNCQKFLVENVRPGQVRFTNVNNGKVFDHPVNGANGSNVYTWEWWGGANQRWILESVSANPPVEVIVDNADAGFSASTNWYSTTYTSGYYGVDYQVRSTEAISDSAAWSATLPESGDYEVYARWTAGTNRAPAAPYIVYYNGGQQTVPMNQQANNGEWVYLGTWNFASGTDVRVRLSCWTTSGYVVIADAIRLYKP